MLSVSHPFQPPKPSHQNLSPVSPGASRNRSPTSVFLGLVRGGHTTFGLFRDQSRATGETISATDSLPPDHVKLTLGSGLQSFGGPQLSKPSRERLEKAVMIYLEFAERASEDLNPKPCEDFS